MNIKEKQLRLCLNLILFILLSACSGDILKEDYLASKDFKALSRADGTRGSARGFYDQAKTVEAAIELSKKICEKLKKENNISAKCRLQYLGNTLVENMTYIELAHYKERYRLAHTPTVRAIKFKVFYAKSREEFSGYVTPDINGFNLNAISETSGVSCVGQADFIIRTSHRDCKGGTGEARLECTDNRIMNFGWQFSDSCSSGLGMGTDSSNEKLFLLFEPA